MDIGCPSGVLAQTGGEAGGNAEFFGEALSKESGGGGSLAFVSMSSWKVQATTLANVAVQFAGQRIEEGYFGRVESVIGVSVIVVVGGVGEDICGDGGRGRCWSRGNRWRNGGNGHWWSGRGCGQHWSEYRQHRGDDSGAWCRRDAAVTAIEGTYHVATAHHKRRTRFPRSFADGISSPHFTLYPRRERYHGA